MKLGVHQNDLCRACLTNKDRRNSSRGRRGRSLNLGAPADEYMSESKDIALAMSKLEPSKITEASVAAMIALIWAKAFNRSEKEIEQQLPAFRRIAQQLIQ